MGGVGKIDKEKRTAMEPGDVEQYLKTNPEFLDLYIQKHISTDVLQKWLAERGKLNSNRKLSLSRWKFAHVNGNTGSITSTDGGGSGATAPDKHAMLKSLALQLHRNPTEGNVLWELAVCITSAISASSFVLYLIDPDSNCLKRFSQLKNRLEDYSHLDEDLTLATYVYKMKEPQQMSRIEAQARFARGLGDNNENLEKSHYVLCHPIIRADGEISGVIELHRQDPKAPFYPEDQEIVNSYLIWGGVALHYADLNSIMNKQKKQSDFLLDVVRSIFQDMISMDILIKKVMNFAQKLVDADRASLFLVDSKTQELYARLFDTGVETEPGGNHTFDYPSKEIRFPVGTGIAGQVAATGEVLNIPDAYKDQRFNRDVDKLTGYVTKTILCMPIFIRGSIIGVVQMVNKRRGVFSKEDEQAFETFAIYCGLALHHAKLYDKIRRSEQKYNVALEVLSYYNTCGEEEFEKARAMGVPGPELVVGIDDFYFNPMEVDELRKIHFAVYMFVDLFGLNRFDLDPIYRFFLTVKKNYRRVPYHNWNHGFTVAHCMYCLLKRTDSFRRLERLALYIGALCHDVDHRGKNNKFMLESASPLAAIYTTSTMEHHHFNQTVTILQRDGHNIFGKLSSEEYKIVLSNIKHCILSTDLAQFFSNKAKLEELVTSENFDWSGADHRLLVEAVSMTAADLCASAKPFDIQLETVKVIFEEFYDQGDVEKRAGRTPIDMMDRDKANEQPASQVGFLTGICIPCYDLVNKVIPETEPLLDACKENLERWRILVAEGKNIE